MTHRTTAIADTQYPIAEDVWQVRVLVGEVSRSARLQCYCMSAITLVRIGDMAVADRLTAFRERLGLSINALARRAEIGVSTVSRIESGQILNPGRHVLVQLSGALGVSVSDLGRHDDGLVFPNQAGGYLAPSNWGVRVWRPLLKTAGVDERVPFRELTRKAQASIMIRLGVDPEALRRRMGHADVSTTFRHYVQATTAADAQAAVSYDRALRALLDPELRTELRTGETQFSADDAADSEEVTRERRRG